MLRGAVIKSLATSQVTQHSRPIGYSPAQDRAIDVGGDALDNVGGGIEEPLKSDPVEDSGVTRRSRRRRPEQGPRRGHRSHPANARIIKT
jgi:hypothetical protein